MEVGREDKRRMRKRWKMILGGWKEKNKSKIILEKQIMCRDEKNRMNAGKKLMRKRRRKEIKGR